MNIFFDILIDLSMLAVVGTYFAGMIALVRNGRRLDIGDAVHSSVISLSRRDWTMGFDGDIATAKVSSRHLPTHLSTSGETISAPPFPFPGVGCIVSAGDHITFKPILKPGKELHQ